MRSIELNCDLGEGGEWDAELMGLVAAANVACGVHAGDAATMRRCVAMARERGIAFGAHPGLPDRLGFGRRELAITPEQARREVYEQTCRLRDMAQAAGVAVRHVKPHGALYNLAARDRGVAEAVADAVLAAGPGLWLVGLADSESIEAGRRRGLTAVREAFADRTYERDGTLTPRDRPGAVLADAAAVIEQVRGLVRHGRICAVDGTELRVEVDTVCLHGDGERAVDRARALRAALVQDGVEIRPYRSDRAG